MKYTEQEQIFSNPTESYLENPGSENSASSRPCQTLVVVLGMHRSGTSAITRALQIVGVNLGNTLMPPAEDANPKGFWEDLHLNNLNIEMLSTLNSEWHHLSPIGYSDLELLRNKGYFLRAVELLRNKVSNTPVFGFKDPRVAKLLPFWKEVFNHCQYNVDYVLAVRNPLSVVKSLAKRDGFNRKKSYLLWLTYVLTSLAESVNNNRIVIDYDLLIESTEHELNRIAKQFDFKIDTNELKSYKSEFLDQNLRHTFYHLEDLYLDESCPPIICEVYATLLDLASDKTQIEDSEILKKIEAWKSELKRINIPLALVDGLYSQINITTQAIADRDGQINMLAHAIADRDGQINTLAHAIADRDSQINTLTHAIADHDGQINTLAHAIADRDGQINTLTHAIADRDGQISILNQSIEKSDEQIISLNQKLIMQEQMNSALNNEIKALRTSSCWRITAPLRWPILQYRQAKQYVKLAQEITEKNHEISSVYLFKRAAKIFIKEGWAGLEKRVDNVHATNQNVLSIKDKSRKVKLFNEADPDALIGFPVFKKDHFDIKIPSSHLLPGATSNIGTEVGFFIHAYYPELLEELLTMLGSIVENASFFFTTDTAHKSDIIFTSLKKYGVKSAVVKVVPNRGRDIAPRLVWMREEIKSVKYAVFLHTKKSNHISGGDSWRTYLWSQLIGSEDLINNILFLFRNNPKLGVLSPHHWDKLTEYQPINWGYSYSKTKELVEELGGTLTLDTPLDFPSGSMFWFRTKAFVNFLDLGLSIEDFEEETGQIDGTKAHAIERAFFYIAECAGFDWAKYFTIDCRSALDTNFNLNNKTIRLLGNNNYESLINNTSPECLPIFYRPYYTEETRINLFIPTIRKTQVYGGIKTAITLFSAIGNFLGLERNIKVRVIVTDDHYVDNPEFLSSSDFHISSLNGDSFEVLSVVMRPALLKNGLEIGAKDIFFASAWWNAKECQRLQNIQSFLFGKCNHFVYFVQDYEPGFYPWSSKSALADSTYNSSLPTIYAVNDRFLYDELKERLSSVNFVIPFGLNDSIYQELTRSESVQREDIVLFYGRPSVSRNLFELIIDSISKWALNDPYEFRKWKVISVGEPYSENLLPEHLRGHIQILGKLDLEAYALLLKKAKIGISLMQSPHPSYPPQEMAAAGLVVITNDWNSKKWVLRSKKYISVQNLDPQHVSDCIQKATRAHVSDFLATDISDIPSQLKVNNDVAEAIARLII